MRQRRRQLFDDMLEAIRARDVARADALAHAHTRQFRDNFIDFMKQNYLKNTSLVALGSGALVVADS